MKTLKIISGDFTKTIQVKEKSNLLTVLQENDLFIDAPCGGQGHCRKCTVFINDTPQLACKTSVDNDLTVKLPEYNTLTLADTKNQFTKELGDIDINPVIKKIEFSVNPQSRISYQSDIQYLKELLKLNISPPANIPLLAKISEATHKKGTYTIYFLEQHGLCEIVDIIAGSNLKNLGLAVDLGTTSVSIVLMDIDKGKIIDSLSFYNPQIIYGADIIHRIVFAQKNKGARLLQEKVIYELQAGIKNLCLKNKLAIEEIKSIVISGNTTMIHLLLGLPTKYIRETPYSSVTRTVPALEANPIMDIINHGKIFVIPCPANYLGGDLISGIISCELHRKNELNVLIDIGTNGEVIIGNKDWLMGCACSAGPAFEGMGLNCGVRYQQGAITDVTVSNNGFNYVVAGGTKPGGISGTGIISLINCLRQENYIDKRGKFTEKVTEKIGAKKAFILCTGKETLNNKPIYVNKTDIDNILRAKAAIYSGMNLLLKKLSLDFNAIDNLYLAGGIGNSLKVTNALDIGLFPPLNEKKIHFVGNSSLTGAAKYLLSKELRAETPEICGKTTYIDLSNEPSYMDEFIAALFIPHTVE